MNNHRDSNDPISAANSIKELDIAQIAISLQEVMSAFPDAAAIVDLHGDIVCANAAFCATHVNTIKPVISGMRFGDVAICTKSLCSSGGCGTSPSCPYCGVNRSITECLNSRKPVIREAFLSFGEGKCMQGALFEVRVSSVTIAKRGYAILALRNISQANYKTCFNTEFIHYLINQLWGIGGLSQCMAEGIEADQVGPVATSIYNVSQEVLERIKEYRLLVNAESGRIVPKDLQIVLSELLENLEYQVLAKLERAIKIEFCCDEGLVIRSDTELLLSSLFYLVSLAMQTARREETVLIRVAKSSGECCFFIHNRSVLSAGEIAGVFSRKYEGDINLQSDLSGYLSKLFVEKYLGGEIGVKSSPDYGTSFFIRLPFSAENVTHPDAA